MIRGLFSLNFSPNWVIKKSNEKESMNCLTLKLSQEKKSLLRKRGSGRLNQKGKKFFLIALATAIKKETTSSIRKDATELKVNTKTIRTANKYDFSQDFNSLVYAIWAIFENKTNTTSHVKTAMEKKWNEISKEIQRHVDKIIEKNGARIE